MTPLFKTKPVEPGTLWLLRVDCSDETRRWIAYSEVNVLRGKFRESRHELLRRWRQQHGTFTKLVRYRGISSAAEAAATMATDMIQDDNLRRFS